MSAVLMAVAAVTAIPTQVEPDLRCLAVTAIASGSLPDAERGSAMAGAMYFVGRIDAQAPGLDYERALRALLSGEQEIAALVKSDARRCGALLQQRGAALRALGTALTRRGER